VGFTSSVPSFPKPILIMACSIGRRVGSGSFIEDAYYYCC
jgi:hypothetical protein